MHSLGECQQKDKRGLQSNCLEEEISRHGNFAADSVWKIKFPPWSTFSSQNEKKTQDGTKRWIEGGTEKVVGEIPNLR